MYDGSYTFSAFLHILSSQSETFVDDAKLWTKVAVKQNIEKLRMINIETHATM